jgi:ATP-dependent protease HslVU (ClpYQ) peptidase subunit
VTCIVGWKAKDRVWIGGDSAGVDTANMMKVVRKDPKVFKLGTEYLIGYAGSFRFGQLLRYKFTPPEKAEGKDDYEFLVADWVEALRTTMKESGFTKVEDNVESLEESSALIAYNGRLYTLEEDLQVGEMVLPYAALGCGADFAWGSLETGWKISKRMAPRKRLQLALEAASTFSAGVMPPFTIMSL